MANIPISSGVKAGWTISRFFRLFFFFLFFAYLLISIILTGIQERDFNLVIKELGEEFLSPIQTAQEFALDIIKSDTNFLGSLWEYWGFYFQLVKIYIWLYLLKKFWDFLFQSTTAPIMRIGLSIASFLAIQLVYITWILDKEPQYLITALLDIFNGLIHIFTNFNFNKGAESSIVNLNNTCNSSVCIY